MEGSELLPPNGYPLLMLPHSAALCIRCDATAKKSSSDAAIGHHVADVSAQEHCGSTVLQHAYKHNYCCAGERRQ